MAWKALEIGTDGAPSITLGDTIRKIKSEREAHQEKEREEAAKAQASLIRRRDAVVDAARTLEDLSVDGVRAFVTQRWSGRRVLEEGDVEQFAADARSQRISDVVDALDSRVRQGAMGWGSRHVKVEMPRGWIRASLRSMTPEEKEQVRQRLHSRGWDEKTIGKALKTFKRELEAKPGVE